MPNPAAVMSNPPASLDSVRIEARHPSEFFAEIANSFRSVDSCLVLPEDAQRGLMFMLKACGLLPGEPHRIPAPSSALPHTNTRLNSAKPIGSRSSSYNAQLGKHVAPAGGFGAPLSVNGAFCHNHDDPDFGLLHPHVDLSTYDSKAQKVAKSDRNRKPLKKPTSPVPSFSTSNRAATPPGSDATVADEEPYTGSIIKAEDPEDSTVIVAHSLFEHGLEDVPERDIALPSNETHDDSGIVVDEPSTSDSQLTDTALNARKSADSQSADSTYESQLYEFVAGTSVQVEPKSAGSNHSDVKDNVNTAEQSQSLKQPRKKLVPKTAYAPRRSSRLSDTPAESAFPPAASASTPTKPTTSLGKHSRQDLEDTVDETTAAAEPEAKRSKDSQD